MPRSSWSRLALTSFLAVMTMPLLAQGGGPGKGMRNYDPKTEVTVQGTIEDVQQQSGKTGWSGTHLLLKTDAATLDVHVGPSSYISKKQFTFAKGDTIEVSRLQSRDLRQGSVAGYAKSPKMARPWY